MYKGEAPFFHSWQITLVYTLVTYRLYRFTFLNHKDLVY